MTTEQIYESEALTKGWDHITEDGKTWCFHTHDVFAKIYRIDKNNVKCVPIFWDDEIITADELKECTYDDVCTLILSSGKTKVLVVVHGNLPHVALHGRVTKEIPWPEYAAEGFMTIKKLITPYRLDAVVINPTVQTLERYGVLKSIIEKFIKDAKLIEGGADESTDGENGENQDGAEE
ncbi:MAG: hypothetical protein ABIM40_09870 [Pseudomonadota bacterium]